VWVGATLGDMQANMAKHKTRRAAAARLCLTVKPLLR